MAVFLECTCVLCSFRHQLSLSIVQFQRTDKSQSVLIIFPCVNKDFCPSKGKMFDHILLSLLPSTGEREKMLLCKTPTINK